MSTAFPLQPGLIKYSGDGTHPPPGMLAESSLWREVGAAGCPLWIRSMDASQRITLNIGGVTRTVALPVTFTPYAAAQPCSARCFFCSENLRREDTQRRGFKLPSVHYHSQLGVALSALKSLPMGLSLSGLEITDNPDWLLSTLDTLRTFESIGGMFTEKVAYSNAAGFAWVDRRARLMEALQSFGCDRLEISRHHYADDINQKIMRFRADQRIAQQSVFEGTLETLVRHLPVTLVCILQRSGIESLAQMKKYLAWAQALGIKKVIFRELCGIPNSYRENKTRTWIELHRTRVEPLVEQWLNESTGKLLRAVSGYYFWNVQWQVEDVEVVVERSDYSWMLKQHVSSVIYKLVFHPNGNLCADWEPEQHVLMRPSP